MRRKGSPYHRWGWEGSKVRSPRLWQGGCERGRLFLFCESACSWSHGSTAAMEQRAQSRREQHLTSAGDTCPVDGDFTHCTHWSFLPENLLPEAVCFCFPRLRAGWQTNRGVSSQWAHLQAGQEPCRRTAPLASELQGTLGHSCFRTVMGPVLYRAWNVTLCVTLASQLLPKRSLRPLTWPCYVMSLSLPLPESWQSRDLTLAILPSSDEAWIL